MKVALTVAGLLICPWVAAQTDAASCGNPFVNGFGPHDYRFVSGEQRQVVERYHFTPAVESLIAGVSGSIGAELDYTLRAFPNHHRALISMMNLGGRMKTNKPPGAQFSVECYFMRALIFKPDDAIARILYAKFLAGSGRKPQALQHMATAADVAKDNAFTQYNIGLVYLEMQEYDKALAQAQRAISMGFERPDLKQKLQAAGKWIEPAPVAVPPAEAEGAASAAAAASAASAPGS